MGIAIVYEGGGGRGRGGGRRSVGGRAAGALDAVGTVACKSRESSTPSFTLFLTAYNSLGPLKGCVLRVIYVRI